MSITIKVAKFLNSLKVEYSFFHIWYTSFSEHNLFHCGYFYWWLFCWSSASLISTFSAISTFRLVTFHRSATFCLNISTTVIFLSWWIHQLRENCYHRIKASLFHDKYWFTTVVFHSIKIDFVCRHRCWEKKNSG